MRRFIGYFVLVLSILALALFELQPQVINLNKGYEFQGGHEIVYRVEQKDEDLDEKYVNKISKEIGDKLEDSGVKNFTVQAESDDISGYYQIRINMGATSTQNLECALKYVEATESITVSTLDNSGKECFFKRGSAEVKYTNGHAYVEIEIEGKDDWITLQSDSESAYKKFMEEQGQDTSTSEITGIMIAWMNKSETDSYKDALEDTPEGIKMADKILSVIPTNYYYPDDGIVKIASWGMGSEVEGLTKESAHALERILNGSESSYSLTRLYKNKIDASGGTNIMPIILISTIGVTLACGIYLVIKYGLTGLTGFVGIVFTDVLSLLVFNFFDYIFTTMSFLGILCSTIIQMVLIINFAEKFNNELLKGRNSSKACNEAFRNSVVTFIDVTLISLLISIVSFYVATNEIRMLPSMIIIGTIAGFLVNILLLKFASSWLCNSKLGLENKKIFRINSKDIPDVSKGESQKKFAPLNKVNFKKGAKGSFIASTVIGTLSIVAIVVLSILSMFTSVTTFNYSNEFSSYGRVEIITEMEDVLDDEVKVKKFLEDYHINLDYSNITIGYDKDVVVEGKEDTVDQINYVSITVDSLIEDEELKQRIISSIRDNIDDEAEVFFTNVNPINPSYKIFNTYLCVGVFVGLALVYVAIRFKYTFAFATLSTLLPTATVFAGLAAATRIPVNTIAITGVLVGVFVTCIAQIPFFNLIKKIKADSKVKIVTKDQREEVITEAGHDSLHIVLAVSLISTVVCGIIAICVPSYLSVCMIGACITSLIGLVANRFILVPVTIFCDRNMSIRKAPKNSEKAKKKLQEKAKKSRTSRAEPEESIIPGIND